MLNQLIESKSNSAESNSRAGFLASTAIFVALFACCAMMWSLFAKDIVSANDSLDMSSLLPPVAIAATEPPKPEPIIKKEITQKTSQSTVVKETTRQVLMTRTDESPKVPDNVSTIQNTSKSRPNGAVIIKNGIENDAVNTVDTKRETNETGVTDKPTRIIKKTPLAEDPKDDPPPTVKKPIVAEVKPKIEPVKPMTQTLGVINGKASSLPKPPFPAAAKAVGASGAVNVQVSIDENGNVTSARAVSGHPLLRAVSEAAARNAKFTQTFLSNQPVKVTGVIVYNFIR